MLDWIYNLLGTMLSWFSNIFFGKNAFALFLYALLFKLLFLPMAIKQQKNQIVMARVAPKMEKHKVNHL